MGNLRVRHAIVAVVVVVFTLAGMAGWIGKVDPTRGDRYMSQPLAGLLIGGACLLGAVLSFLWCRGRGRNRVFGSGGARDAAAMRTTSGALGDAHTVTDAELAAMASTEFVPPPGIAPWEGQVLVTERFIKINVFLAYLSGLAGQGAIEITPTHHGVAFSPGPNFALTAPEDRRHLDALFTIANPYRMEDPNRLFKPVFATVIDDLHQRLIARQWWSRKTPRPRSYLILRVFLGCWGAVMTVLLWIIPAWFLVAAMRNWLTLSVVVSALAGLIVGRVAYGVLLHARTAVGSAMALRTESFRHFFQVSEGRHVEQVWRHGQLLEYSAWAVALGEAASWSTACRVAAHAVPGIGTSNGLLLMHEKRNSMLTASVNEGIRRRRLAGW